MTAFAIGFAVIWTLMLAPLMMAVFISERNEDDAKEWMKRHGLK